ncbi:Ett1p ASCRUDRAFT_40244 [Ascoidea rubescens DSM 1968]|uniref:Enhancer of translation termination 1 n=1 Tax=Ascoidea rubescens DSM 1968 TaxID=1344418 RepID=A0A1D2V8M6_9ASCO|nr:hypothetical protein ASCRUDRAFT_40244 [Ascoidea rubescens DSM 1968]ODV57867.1 hypothetical protein ASCRUDRAFT_40244 [Ascoidea rubescens DSM 1968]
MSRTKRPLGIGKASKQKKKIKIQDPESTLPKTNQLDKNINNDENENFEKIEIENIDSNNDQNQSSPNNLTIELSESVDPNDEIAQLIALWKTYKYNNDSDNQLILNGIVHECDRLLRESDLNKETKKKKKALNSKFHTIYSLALYLPVFENNKIVAQFLNASLERVNLGLNYYTKSIDLTLARIEITLNKIPLQYISNLDLSSRKYNRDKNSQKIIKIPNFKKIIENLIQDYEYCENSIIEDDEYLKNYYNLDHFNILNSFDDLLDIIENFGIDHLTEGLDSDIEDENEKEIKQKVKLSKKHPLYQTRESIDKYYDWLNKRILIFAQNLLKKVKLLNYKSIIEIEEMNCLLLYKKVNHKIGEKYLIKAEGPSNIYTSVVYSEDGEEESELSEINKLKELQKEGIKNYKKAIKHFKKAEDEEDTQSWVDIAEAEISLGNLYDLKSKEQEKFYKRAEDILRKANKVSHGKYEHILIDLLGDEE